MVTSVCPRNSSGRNSGFTLVELVIVMAIVGLLAAIAFPSYQKHLARSNRSVAKKELTQLMALQEARFLRARSYGTELAHLRSATDDVTEYYVAASGRNAVLTDPDLAYKITLDITMVGSEPQFDGVSAIAQGVQAARDPECLGFVISANGSKSASSNAGTDTTPLCWGE